MEDKIVARVVILPEVINEKTKSVENLTEYYGDWYKFNNTELDVSLYSKSFLNKEKTIESVTYFYRIPESKEVKLIPQRHCKVVYQFL